MPQEMSGAAPCGEKHQNLAFCTQQLVQEQRRLRGDLTAPHKSLPGGAVRGARALLPCAKGKEERKWPQMAPGEAQVGDWKQFFPARVVRPWDELPREWWSRCLWECSGGVWMWPLGTGFGVLLVALGWHWVILEGSSHLSNSGIL